MSGGRPERMAKPYRQHLKSGKDLETTYEAIRAGFVTGCILIGDRIRKLITRMWTYTQFQICQSTSNSRWSDRI